MLLPEDGYTRKARVVQTRQVGAMISGRSKSTCYTVRSAQ